VRENEICRETDIREVGTICLSCGHRQGKATEPGFTRDFPPVEWDVGNLSARNLVAPASRNSVVKNYIEQRTVDLQATVVVNESQLPETVHEKTDP